MHGSQRVVIALARQRSASRCMVGRPPFGPYDAFIRAITTGRSKLPRAVAGDGLLRDLRHRVRRRVRRVHLAERVGLEEHVHRIVLRPVDRVRRHHQRRLRLAAVREQQPGPLGVHADRVVEVEPGPLERGEVQHVGEVVGQLGEVAVADVAHDAWSRRARRPARASRRRRSGRSPTPRCRPRGARRAGTRSARPVR